MSLYMYQLAYTPKSWAAQIKHPDNREEVVGSIPSGSAIFHRLFNQL